MPAPEEIKKLVAHFQEHYDSYKNSSYNETQLRREFLDPFFKALGWDIDNEQGLAEAYKDVVHEDSIKIGGYTKAPDYCFRVGGQRKFFVEAKKPSINLKDDTSPAFQLRRYGWSAKLPISILSDFEELVAYDNRLKPIKSDKASKGRILYIRFEEYIDRWDEIAAIFSKDAVLKGSFDAFAEKSKVKKGADEVDKEFLKEIESWREDLAKDIASSNPSLDTWQINFAVQKTIDRIIFLRIAEDRGIEQYGRLMALQNGDRVYKRLVELFERADEKYNSGLFHFKPEKNIIEPADELTQQIKISDDTLKSIFKNLYYPESPYEFSVLPADILGQVYEQFLGKVIRLTAGHRAIIEEKPEVRKAGGVYYTPTYIVDYIVKNTVGKLLENKTPKQVAKLRILDPACGSGSFLLGAYQYLLDWHRDYYAKENPVELARGKNPLLYQTHNGEWRLTTAEKRRILLNNIYGVDIDSQAVEVTKLSLSLKVLEGENEETLNRQLRLFNERALPDLGNNIKCGNSLIGPDYFTSQLMPDPAELRRINPFDWNHEFRDIMSSGGFDAVIGNPPWAFTKYVDWGESTKKYISKTYLTTPGEYKRGLDKQSGKVNLFAIFTLKGIALLNNKGIFGFIEPNNILRTTVYDIIRKNILESYSIIRIVSLGAGVFSGVTASTVILLVDSKRPTSETTIEIIDNAKLGTIQGNITNHINQKECLNNPSFVIDIFTDTTQREVLQKIDMMSVPLGSIVDVLNGVATHKEKAGILSNRKDKKSKPILFGRDIDRYYYAWSGKYVDYDREKLLRARSEDIFLSPEKLIMQRIGGILITAYDDKQYYTFNSVNNLLLRKDAGYSLKYVLGLLNSKLLRQVYRTRFSNKSTLTVNISKTFLDRLPIRKIDTSNATEEMMHDKVVGLVQRMLDYHKLMHDPKNTQDNAAIQRQITATDHEIDQLVYKLYGLTSEEIKIVESNI